MEHIKELMKSGDVKVAAEELKKILAAEPDNAEAKMLYGTCCHLLGDDETFKKIHDDLALKMGKEKDVMHLSHWQKYRGLYEKLTIAVLVTGAVAGGAYYFGKEVQMRVGAMLMVSSLYAAPEYAAPDYVTTNTATCEQIVVDNHVRQLKVTDCVTDKSVKQDDRR